MNYDDMYRMFEIDDEFSEKIKKYPRISYPIAECLVNVKIETVICAQNIDRDEKEVLNDAKLV